MTTEEEEEFCDKYFRWNHDTDEIELRDGSSLIDVLNLYASNERNRAIQEYQQLEKELFDYKSLAKNYRTENYKLLELIETMKTNAEFSENYLRSGMTYPNRGDRENISNVFNGAILAYWLETNQCKESELSEKQKEYAGLKKPDSNSPS